MKKILSIVGARPQFIKEAAIQSALKEHKDITEVLVHTGQHYDTNMSGVFFDVLSMKSPDYNLGISETLHGAMTGRMLIELEEVMINEKPDLVLLYGDTNSTTAGALAARKLKLQVAHVEAGLRQKKPKYIPEETNRIVTDHVSDYLFCPSQIAVDNLYKENIKNGVYFTGDVMYDIFLKMKPSFDYSMINELGLAKDNYILMTLHRDFNVDNKDVLTRILVEISKIAKEIPVVYPLHPRTRKRIQEFGLEDLLSGLIITEPIDYLKLMGLTENCFRAITDSGGYQKETYFAGKRAAVLMPETGWVELINNDWNILAEPNDLYGFIYSKKSVQYESNIYGRGNASEEILRIIKEVV